MSLTQGRPSMGSMNQALKTLLWSKVQYMMYGEPVLQLRLMTIITDTQVIAE